jgi:hypothetical protein
LLSNADAPGASALLADLQDIRDPAGTEGLPRHCDNIGHDFLEEASMGRGILLWLLGIPIPIIILIMLFAR